MGSVKTAEQEIVEAQRWLAEHPDEPGELPPKRLPSGETSRKEKSDWLARSFYHPIAYDGWEDGFAQFEEMLAPGALSRSKSLKQRRLAAQVEHCMGFLKPAQRELLELRFFEFMTLEEIGNLLGISYQAVQSRLKTAYQDMKAAIAAHGNEVLDVASEDL